MRPTSRPDKQCRYERRDAARAHRITALQRRITHQRLQKQRQLRRCAVKDDADDRHQHQANGKIPTSQNPQVHQRMFHRKFPYDKRNHGNSTEMPANHRIHSEPNQSASCPLSSAICSVASQTTSRPNPTKSIAAFKLRLM